MMMGLINRLAGGVFGTLKYLLIIAIFMGLLAESGIINNSIFAGSQTAGAMQGLGVKLFPGIKQIGQKAVNLPDVSAEAE